MSIFREKHKSYSLTLPQEIDESLERELAEMTPQEREAFFLLCHNKEFQHFADYCDQDSDMVPIDQWLDDDYYMGRVTKTMYPVWRSDLIEIFGSRMYSQALITGSTGTGKSFFSHLVVLRMIYEASCLRDPARTYGLSSGSTIGFCTIANSKETARRVVFEGISSKMKESPYFQYDFCPKRETKDEIVFPKGLQIVAGSSTDTSIMGMNIFGGVMDEGNFVRTSHITSSSTSGSSSQRAKNLAKATRLYSSIVRRMKSRFNRNGRLPGILCILSSKTTHDSFTEEIIRKADKDGDRSIFIRDRSLIDVKRDQFSKETFKILVGNESYPSRILAANEDQTNFGRDALVIDVPEDLRKDFEINMEESLRDLLGVATMAISSFMQRVDLVEKMKDPTRSHPFVCALMGNSSEWDSRLPYRMNWSQIARQRKNGDWEPILNPYAPRVVGLDPASTGDAFGICIGHISHVVPATSGPSDDDSIQELQPFFHIDFMLRIQGRPGEEVIFKNVRKLIYEFSEHGFHIGMIKSDTYQHKEMLFALNEQGYNAEVLSVDTSKDPYRYLRTVIYDERIKCYDYPQLFTELKNLEETPLKVDHRPGSGKDIADAMAQVLWTLFQEYNIQQPMLPEKGRSEMPMGHRVSKALEGSLPLFQVEETMEREEELEVSEAKQEVLQAAASGSKVYTKKNPPKSVGPSYKKRNTDGSAEVLAGGDSSGSFDAEDFMVRG